MIKKLIQKWLGMQPNGNKLREVALAGHAGVLDADAARKVQVTMFEAVNGRILQVGVYKPNPMGSDWTFHLYVVQPDQTLPDALAVCLLVAGSQ